ncbi:Hypothetical predicted protein [Cloeon dipterum]|uniref:Uncharacterized protein n=1 Tax=Cloeon dipterum TaxID=197152 RepID=A0A8S1E933_9INSE|nr:Hypothetical predicted protein [Cloeon dipterum]
MDTQLEIDALLGRRKDGSLGPQVTISASNHKSNEPAKSAPVCGLSIYALRQVRFYCIPKCFLFEKTKPGLSRTGFLTVLIDSCWVENYFYWSKTCK